MIIIGYMQGEILSYMIKNGGWHTTWHLRRHFGHSDATIMRKLMKELAFRGLVEADRSSSNNTRWRACGC